MRVQDPGTIQSSRNMMFHCRSGLKQQNQDVISQDSLALHCWEHRRGCYRKGVSSIGLLCYLMISLALQSAEASGVWLFICRP